mmetsp:Transcript_9450/g.12727  ORF Transcript_9450/g.12727 Transcript_9450/m.12727 type:complete len:138 (+) Transcript_9450:131-544(+)
MEELNLAVETHSFEKFKSLIEDGYPMEVIGEDSPIHRASFHGRVKFINYLIEKGVNVDNQKEDDWAPLHLAAYNGYAECIEILLNAGANPSIKNGEGMTPKELVEKTRTLNWISQENFQRMMESLEGSNFSVKPAKS